MCAFLSKYVPYDVIIVFACCFYCSIIFLCIFLIIADKRGNVTHFINFMVLYSMLRQLATFLYQLWKTMLITSEEYQHVLYFETFDSQVAQLSKAQRLSARGVTRHPGSNPDCVSSKVSTLLHYNSFCMSCYTVSTVAHCVYGA